MITQSSAPAVQAVLALEALNSFVRSVNATSYWGLAPHVYEMKNRAIRRLDEAGLLVRRKIAVTVKCGKCWNFGAVGDTDAGGVTVECSATTHL